MAHLLFTKNRIYRARKPEGNSKKYLVNPHDAMSSAILAPGTRLPTSSDERKEHADPILSKTIQPRRIAVRGNGIQLKFYLDDLLTIYINLCIFYIFRSEGKDYRIIAVFGIIVDDDAVVLKNMYQRANIMRREDHFLIIYGIEYRGIVKCI